MESKRRNMGAVRDWSGLNHDVLWEIAVRVPLVEDFMAFRGVCNTWRAAGKNSFKPLKHSVPLLMLPEESRDTDEVRFYSLSRRKVSMRLSLPEMKDKECFAAGFGWLLALDLIRHEGDASLINPLSGARIELPNFNPRHLRRAVLSADPSRSSDYVVMVTWGSDSQGLGVWRTGDESWTECTPLQVFKDVTCYREKFYAVREVGRNNADVCVFDPFGSDITILMQIRIRYDESACFVESSDGELLLVTRRLAYYGRAPDRDWQVTVRRLDKKKREWETISGLGNDAIFIGGNASIAVATPAFPCFVEPNCIYFTARNSSDKWFHWFANRALEKGVYHLGNDSLQDFDLGSIVYGAYGRKPTWFAPSS